MDNMSGDILVKWGHFERFSLFQSGFLRNSVEFLNKWTKKLNLFCLNFEALLLDYLKLLLFTS